MDRRLFLVLFPAILLLLCRPVALSGESTLETQNVVLITLDGLRWQEVFTGAEQQLIDRDFGGVRDTNAIRKTFWRETPEARREALLPFFWNVIAREGQLFGNPGLSSIVEAGNGLNFSYPGYNELLTGAADSRIDSNDKLPNPNLTVLEWLHRQPAFQGRIAAFAAWDVFPYILNQERSGIPVTAGWNPLPVEHPTPRQALLNELIRDTTRAWDSVAYDSFVFQAVLEHLRQNQPRVLYVAFGETDDWAHDGRYDRVLLTARQSDDYIRRLWELLQSLPAYRNQTTFIVTTDHGRGDGLIEWRHHGRDKPGSEKVWLAVLGPDTPPLGERRNAPRLTLSQTAATVAAFLGEEFGNGGDTAPPVEGVIRLQHSR
jgi:hypothetical protein